MTLLTPFALGLSLIAVPIVLMYVLKLRRQEQMVSSTLLWRRALEDVQANAPWQRLRPSMLLLLQLLVLVALVLALAAPAYSRSHTYSGDLIVIVDQSYGMQARDVAPSRFDAALTRARTLAADLPAGSVMSVIGMGAQARLAVAESTDRGTIDAALGKLRVSEAAPNFLAALSLASSLARSGETTQAIVLTSRESGIASLPLHVPFPVDVIRIGGELHDLGITATSAARSGSGTQAIVRVANFGYRRARSDLDLYVDGQLADVRPLSVDTGKEESLFWTALPSTTRVVRAQLIVRDDVTVDKTAWAVVPPPVTHRLLLVSSGDYFLQTALALGPSIALSVERPDQYVPSDASRFDLVVFDGTFPAQLPAAPTLLIAPPAGRVGPLRIGAALPAGSITEAGPTSTSLASILQYADLSDVHIARVREVSLPGWMQPLAVSNGLTVLAAGDTGSTRLGIIPFQLQASDWPLRISFPIVLQNLVGYLAPGLTGGVRTVSAGSPVTFLPSAGIHTIQVVRPDGVVDTVHSPFPPFTDTARPGLYTVQQTGTNRSATFAADFFPARPAPASGPAIEHLGVAGSHTRSTASAHVSVAWVFGLLGLTLLSLEWWYAFRR